MVTKGSEGLCSLRDHDQWALSLKQPAMLGCTTEVDNMNGGVLVLGHKMSANAEVCAFQVLF